MIKSSATSSVLPTRRHVQSVFRIVFVSSHFVLQIANLVHGAKTPPRWVSVSSPSDITTIELPSEMISNLNLPRHENMISRSVVEKREVILVFQSRAAAVEYATGHLGLDISDEADSSVLQPKESWLTRLWSRFF
jgi:hypothetical protein